MVVRAITACLVVALASAPALAQLPADAIDLALVKISEKQKSTDLCPVYLVKSDPNGPTWEHNGVTYRGSQADAKEKFMADPDKFAAAAAQQVFVSKTRFALSHRDMISVECAIMPGAGSV